MPVGEVVQMADQAAATVGVTPSRRHKALPMSHALRAQEPAIGFLVTAYGGIVLVASVPLTLLTQHLPRRLVLCCVLAALVVTSLSSAAASTNEVLLWSRVATALSQVPFWALVVPTAAGLVPPAERGRAVAAVFAGVSIANVIGVPGGTWIGQAGGWRASFVSIAALALMVTALLRPCPLGALMSGPPTTRTRAASGSWSRSQYWSPPVLSSPTPTWHRSSWRRAASTWRRQSSRRQ